MLDAPRYFLNAGAHLVSLRSRDRGDALARLELGLRLLRHGGTIDLSGIGAQQEFADILRTFVPSGHSLTLNPSAFPCDATLSDGISFRFGGAIVDSSRRPVGVVQRRLVLGRALAVHELLYLIPDVRGDGLGPQVLRDSLHLYDRLGIRQIQLQASLETGRFYWAFLGWDFSDHVTRSSVLTWSSEAAAALGQAGATATLSSAYELAHLDTGSTATFSDLIAAFPARASELRSAAAANALGVDTPLALGRLLMLSGPDWFGVLDLRSGQRAILESYLVAKLGTL